jgi:predicted permease
VISRVRLVLLFFVCFSLFSWCSWFVCSSWFHFFHSACSHLFVCSRVHTQTVLGGLGVVLCCNASGCLVYLSIFVCLFVSVRKKGDVVVCTFNLGLASCRHQTAGH